MRYIAWTLTLPILLVAALFAISNREDLPVGLWPLPQEFLVPGYLMVLLPLAAGLLIGGAVVWLGSMKYRRLARRRGSRLRALNRELDEMRQKQQARDEADARAAEKARPTQAPKAPKAVAAADRRPVPALEAR